MKKKRDYHQLLESLWKIGNSFITLLNDLDLTMTNLSRSSSCSQIWLSSDWGGDNVNSWCEGWIWPKKETIIWLELIWLNTKNQERKDLREIKSPTEVIKILEAS